MEELVRIGSIKAKVSAADWKDAVTKAGSLLVESGDIKKEYIDNMIASVEEYGPYMVISKGFALAHAAPCEAVINDSFSLINLEKGVEFGSPNDPVDVILCMACKDKESHMENMMKIAKRLMAPGAVQALSDCEDDVSLYRCINGENKEV